MSIRDNMVTGRSFVAYTDVAQQAEQTAKTKLDDEKPFKQTGIKTNINHLDYKIKVLLNGSDITVKQKDKNTLIIFGKNDSDQVVNSEIKRDEKMVVVVEEVPRNDKGPGVADHKLSVKLTIANKQGEFRTQEFIFFCEVNVD